MTDLIIKLDDKDQAQATKMAERVKKVLAAEFGITVEITTKKTKTGIVKQVTIKKASPLDKMTKGKNLAGRIKQGLDEVKLMQEGKLQRRSAMDLVKELKNSK
ncbi:hypothetical protein Q0590_25350 [Rhodocytophaga aerolata]|uniref:Uncharacterized protein n=1 Tax=Rhodocytophaga aerolata TaxID=455078 RepID=A0ABT8RC94_9BACT|nr:hypothetical protein [Rhodocytophaga aerolata]MDO1449629.1 hypothetical protein [Rhodocytophaga aerolata]